MTIREIITVPNPILRRKARKVTEFGKDFQTLVDDMIETMRDAPGVGLAAPQVGVSQRLVVVEYAEECENEEDEKPPKLYILANPEISPLTDEKITGIEGCLSVPEMVGEVERFTSILIKGENRHGKPVRIKAKDWMARIFQHEIDHLEGVLYTDLASKVWKPGPEEEIPLD